METSLSLFFDSWDFFRDAALSGMTAGILLGAIGVFILLKRMVFMSAALSQISSAAIAFGIFCQLTLLAGATHWWNFLFEPSFCASIFCLLVILGLSWLQSRKKADNTALIALLYLLGSAATLLLGTRIVTEIQDIQQLLVGNAVLVSNDDFHTLIWTTCIILFILAIFRRGFEISSFHTEGARVAGVPVTGLQFVLFLLIAVAISIATRILGALPVFAFSVLPAMSARLLCHNVRSMILLSGFLGGLSGIIGYIVAFLYEFPVGPSQTMVGICCVVLACCLRIIFYSARRLHSKIKFGNQSKSVTSER